MHRRHSCKLLLREGRKVGICLTRSLPHHLQNIIIPQLVVFDKLAIAHPLNLTAAIQRAKHPHRSHAQPPTSKRPKMPPIPVHIDEPITPSKAQGVTQKTPQPDPTKTTSADAGVTTAAAGGPPPAYPRAQPAAAPVPGAPPFAPPTPTRTTQSPQDAVPPPPQPGAVPTPSAQPTSSLPPPPRAGQGSAFTSALNAMHAPPPQINLAPTHSTDPSTPTRQYQPATTVNLGPVNPPPSVSASHPTGYQQNLFAQEMSPAQRASLDQQEESERRGSMFAGLPGGQSGGAGGNGVIGEDASQTAGNMWNAMKGWASAAGSKVAEAEAAAWKKIEGKK